MGFIERLENRFHQRQMLRGLTAAEGFSAPVRSDIARFVLEPLSYYDFWHQHDPQMSPERVIGLVHFAERSRNEAQRNGVRSRQDPHLIATVLVETWAITKLRWLDGACPAEQADATHERLLRFVEANLTAEEIGRATIPTTTYLALRGRLRPHRSMIVRKLLRLRERFIGRIRRLHRGGDRLRRTRHPS
jgi:hypothetical protein